jgi:hypothetical protein
MPASGISITGSHERRERYDHAKLCITSSARGWSEPKSRPRLAGFYGLGIIIGSGVYVVIGDVIAKAGVLAVCAFAVARALAGLTALAYAELGARHPEATGAAAYVKEAFGSDRFSHALVITGVVKQPLPTPEPTNPIGNRPLRALLLV